MSFVFEGYAEPKTKTSPESKDKFVFEGYQEKSNDPARLAMQAAIGLGKGAIYSSPAAVPALAGEVALPGAIQNVIGELLESDIEHQALYPGEFPALNREQIEKGAQEAEESLLGGEGLVGGLISSPFRAAGIETNPQTGAEKTTRGITEFLALLKSGKADNESLKKAAVTAFAGQAGKETLIQMGVPEWVADLLGIGAASALAHATPKTKYTGPKSKSAAVVEERIASEPPGGGPPGGSGPIEEFRNKIKSNLVTEEDLLKNFSKQKIANTKFETAEKALEEITGKPKELKTSRGPLGIEVKAPEKSSQKQLNGIVEKPEGPGAVISELEFETEAAGGRAQNITIRENAANARREVSEAYKEAEENYKNINSIADKALLTELKYEAAKIRESAKPNTAESVVLKTIEDVIDHYIVRNGVSVRTLIRTSDSISGMANYELPFTGPKDILKTVANALDRAAIRAIENNGGNAELQRLANRKYGEWANKYANDDVSPFLERTVNNPESLFRQSIDDEGAYRAVQSALHDSPRAKEFTDAMARQVAEKKMGKFKDDEIGSSEYRRALRNLEALIGHENSAAYDQALRQAIRIPRPKDIVPTNTKESSKKLAHRITSVPESTKIAMKVAKYKDTNPEEIISKLKSRSGIKELKKDFPKKSFDMLVEQEARSILHEGKIEKTFAGDDLYRILNKESNFEIFAEILGTEEANLLREAAKNIGKQNMSSERLKNSLFSLTKQGAKIVLGLKAFNVLKALISAL